MTKDAVKFHVIKRGNVTSFLRHGYERLSEKVFDLPNLRSPASQAEKADSPTGRGWLLSIFTNDTEKILVRHYEHGGIFGKIVGDLFVYPKRPLNELEVSETAQCRGLPTSDIVAIRQEKVFKCFYRLDLFSKEIPNSIDLIRYFTEFSLSPTSASQQIEKLREKRNIIAAAAKTIRKMHDAGIYHADLHLKNILVQSADPSSNELSACKIFIIDFDKSKVKDKLSLKEKMKNIMRLERSTQKWPKVKPNISATDKLRFLNVYAENDKSLWENRKAILRRFRGRYTFRRLLWRLLRIT